MSPQVTALNWACLFVCLFVFCLFFQVWDLRKNDVLYQMNGHTDTVTGLRLSPDGSFLLSNAMDNTGKSNRQTNRQTNKQQNKV